jgi:hypothetical protein
MPPPCNSSIHVLDNGVWAVSAAGGFRVPRALVILALDGVRVAEDFLTPTQHGVGASITFFAPSKPCDVPKTQGPLGSQAEWPLGRTVLRFRSPSE